VSLLGNIYRSADVARPPFFWLVEHNGYTRTGPLVGWLMLALAWSGVCDCVCCSIQPVKMIQSSHLK
jgi:hypothetical protein